MTTIVITVKDRPAPSGPEIEFAHLSPPTGTPTPASILVGKLHAYILAQFKTATKKGKRGKPTAKPKPRSRR